jgi:hypothetical protein
MDTKSPSTKSHDGKSGKSRSRERLFEKAAKRRKEALDMSRYRGTPQEPTPKMKKLY